MFLMHFLTHIFKCICEFENELFWEYLDKLPLSDPDARNYICKISIGLGEHSAKKVR